MMKIGYLSIVRITKIILGVIILKLEQGNVVPKEEYFQVNPLKQLL